LVSARGRAPVGAYDARGEGEARDRGSGIDSVVVESRVLDLAGDLVVTCGSSRAGAGADSISSPAPDGSLVSARGRAPVGAYDARGEGEARDRGSGIDSVVVESRVLDLAGLEGGGGGRVWLRRCG
jgi:hypothetical protein